MGKVLGDSGLDSCPNLFLNAKVDASIIKW
jgi:hypothetical protein